MALVNQLKTDGNLKDYIIKYLSNTYLYNMITHKTDRAINIINWDKCYGLAKLFRYKVCPSIKFATRQKYFDRVEDIKQENLKEKVTEIIEYDDFEPIYKKKYRYEYITELKPYEEIEPYTRTRKDYEPIYKRRKIGKKYYYTTEYKIKTIRETEYRYVTKYQKIQKRVRVPYIVTEYKPIKKQKKVTKIKTVGTKDVIKAVYDYKFKYYIQYFLYEMYRENEKGKVIHECFINPFYSGYSVAEPTFLTINKKPIYSLPSQVYNSGSLTIVTENIRSQITGKKPKDLKEGKTEEFFKKERKYKSNYVYDENVTDCIFFIDYDTRKNNLEIEQIQ